MSGGVKRDRDGNARAKNSGASKQSGPKGRFNDMFEGFRNELDEHHDRRERIVKASRDVTAMSKKIIFTLQRVKHLNKDFPPHIQQDIDTRLEEISKLLSGIAPDLQNVNRYRYTSPLRCLEEFVEALSFAHYLRHQTLITPTQAQAAMPADMSLTTNDYMYGIFDLFGELMRFATVTTAQTGELAGNGERNIMSDIQELGCAFELLPDVPTKDWRGKMGAMRQSVKKVEKLGYGLVVRGSERPKGWVPDMKDDAPEPTSP
ncbi:translin-associated x [Fusarium longipes]|uniref:Translin-associated x n=1 Tax=Fusarium longipes TaxID=694270 RepID=A0A395T4C8_9HYPO|nr:translin-associated x [Fusarium longipes]